MIRLNIIPENLKKERSLKQLFVNLYGLLSFLLVNICVYAIILLVLQLILELQFIKISGETTVIMKSSENYTNKIRVINNQVSEAAQIQEDAVYWSLLFEDLSNNTPDDIKLNSVNINKTKDSLNIKGLAATRESLITFKEWLEGRDQFQNIDFPVKNLLEKENISFDIKAEFKNYESYQPE